MILNDLLHHGQSQTGAIFLTVTDKAMKQVAADEFLHPRPIIGYCNRNGAGILADADSHVPPDRGSSFAGVKQQVIEGALQLARIKPSRAMAIAFDVNGACVMPGMQ